MTDPLPYRVENPQPRVLFCIGVLPAFFEAPSDGIPDLAQVIEEAFADLQGRFGVRVLGTLDDDEMMVGPSLAWPWTAYILAEVPDLATVTKVCDIVRSTPVGDGRLWRYLRIEARLGRELFFGTS